MEERKGPSEAALDEFYRLMKPIYIRAIKKLKEEGRYEEVLRDARRK